MASVLSLPLVNAHQQSCETLVQLAIPVEISLREIARKTSLGAAIELCVDGAGLQPKQVLDVLKIDKTQWSRWISAGEGVNWPKLCTLMDHCGNEAPVLWMAHTRGYDMDAMRKRETELQRELRMAKDQINALRAALKSAL